MTTCRNGGPAVLLLLMVPLGKLGRQSLAGMLLLVWLFAGVALSAITEVTTGDAPEGSQSLDSVASGAPGKQAAPFATLPEWITPMPYHVAGRSKPEIREAMRQAVADLNGGPEGSDFGAVTSSRYSYEIAGNRRLPAGASEGMWICTASGSVTVNLSVTIGYPVWDNLATSADSQLIAEWKSYAEALYRHELGHAYIARTGLRRLELELAGIEASATATDSAEACELAVRAHRDLVDEAFKRITDEISHAQQEYDALTDYGRSHGASF